MAPQAETGKLRAIVDAHPRAILAVILIAGAGLRAAYLVEVLRSPIATVPMVDAEFHHYWARGLATGDWETPYGQPDPHIQTAPYLRPPGYPFFLAAVYKVFGVGFVWPRVVQMLLGLLSARIAFAIGRRWFGTSAGLLFAAAMSLHWGFIYFEAELMEPAVLIPLLLGTAWAVGRWGDTGERGFALLGGVLLGLGCTLRPNALLLVPAIAYWMWWVWRAKRRVVPPEVDRPRASVRSATSRGASRAAGLSGALLLLLGGVAFPILPVTARNLRVANDLVLISSNAGVNLFIGHNESADGFFFSGAGGIPNFGSMYDYDRVVRSVERDVGRRMKHSEVSRYFARRALSYMWTHPVQTITRTARKLLLLLHPKELSHNNVVAIDRSRSAVLRFLPFPFAVVLGGAIFGAWCAFRSRGGTAGVRSPAARTLSGPADRVFVLMLIFPVVYLGSFLPFFAASLYRVPAIPFLLLLGALGLSRVGQMVLGRGLREAAPQWAGLVAAIGLVSVPLVPYEPDEGEWHHKRGIACRRSGDLTGALEHLRAAHELDPGSARVLWTQALVQMEQGRLTESLETWERAASLAPGNADLLTDLGDKLLSLGKPAEAADAYRRAIEANSWSVVPYVNLANMLASRGDVERAIQLFRRALGIDDRAFEVHLGLGLALGRIGAMDEAIAHVKQAVLLNPESVEAAMNLGVVLKESGRPRDAIEAYRHASSLDPRNAYVLHNMGAAYEDLMAWDDAAAMYRNALAIDPKLTLTMRSLARVLRRQGERSEGLEWLRRSVEVDPQDVASWRALAQALAADGRSDEADEAFQRLLAIDPEDEDARAWFEQGAVP